jgi:hypothetical protein
MGRVNISERAVVGKERNVEDTKLRRLPRCGAAVHHKRRMHWEGQGEGNVTVEEQDESESGPSPTTFEQSCH